MATFILLSLSPLIGLLILCAFRGVSVTIARKQKSITNESIVREKSALEKNDDKSCRPTRIFIPNVLARWPWPRRINSNYAVVKKESDAWMATFQAYSPKAQDASYRCNFSKSFPLYLVRILILFNRSPRLFSLPYSQKR
jgi:hypothetical protein